MLDDFRQSHCACFATHLQVAARNQPDITIAWLYRSFHRWIHGNNNTSDFLDNDQRVVAFLTELDEEMATSIARQANIPYDRTILVSVILSAYNNGE